jgi:hypothetical protein
MTSRERMTAAIRGAAVDRKPTVHWPYWSEDSDVRHYSSDTLPDHIERDGDDVVLVEVTNPFGIAMQKSIDLNFILKDDPKSGNRILGELADETRRSIDRSFEAGADGVIYRLYGARARHCTPMQYGGHYLELDRELLDHAKGALMNLLFVVGEDDVYLDFVSDLPAEAFGWDSAESKISAEDVRLIRAGALFSEDTDSDILLTASTSFLSKVLESSLRSQDAYVV